MTNKEEVIEEKDHHGNTPLMLTVKLSHMSKDYVNLARILLKNGANPRSRDREGWSILDEAIEKNDPVLVALIFDFLHKTRRK